ncbi:MAG TPA: ABC transporter ATP-binding protein [Albitalea sp.]
MIRLEARGLTYRHPDSEHSIEDVDLTIERGSFTVITGRIGAGKTTLVRVLLGLLPRDAGEVRWNGEPVAIRSPHEARRLGISMVFQHFSLFDTLTAAENVWLGLEKSASLAEVTRRIAQVAHTYGLDVDPLRPVHTLSVGERQRVEIVRALMTSPKLLILDEPTSVLTPQAVEKLFVTLRQLAGEGCSILYISHKLDEIRALCHHCTVLRGGRVTGEVDPTKESNASLSRLMIGAEPPPLQHGQARAGDVVLGVRELSLPKQDQFGMSLERIELDVRAGEIVGIAGVSGNGQQELMAALSGEDARAAPESIRLFGRPIGRLSPAGRRRRGLHFVPEERLGRGAVPSLSLAQNTLLTRTEAVSRRTGWVRTRAVHALARSIIGRFNVKASGPDAPAKSLSGGNLQKFIVGREIDAKPRLLIVAQPTWGVDVGAAAQIRAELLKLRDAGCALLVVSEELDELFEISDRLHVIAQGRLSPSLPTARATVEQVGQWMSGLWNEPEGALSHAGG